MTLNTFYSLLTKRPGKAKEIKKAFADFNESFQELHTVSSGYTLYNDKLKKQIRDELRGQVAEPYKAFYENYFNNKFTQNRDKYFVYTPESVEECIEIMFEAKTSSNGEAKELTELVTDFFKSSSSRLLPKMSTLSSLATPLAYIPKGVKKVGKASMKVVGGMKKIVKKTLPLK